MKTDSAIFYSDSHLSLRRLADAVRKGDRDQIEFRIRSASVRLTENCCSRCLTCDCWKTHQSVDEHLSVQDWKEIILQLVSEGIDTLYVTGGEPLLYKGTFELISFAREQGVSTIKLLTNGLLLEQHARNVHSGTIDELWISLDGIGRTNDLIRGIDGHFNTVLDMLSRLQFPSNQIHVSMTLLRDTIDDYDALRELCTVRGYRFGINLPSTKSYYFRGGNVRFPTQKQVDKFLALSGFDAHTRSYVSHYLLNNGDDTNYTCVMGLKVIYIGYKGDVYSGCHVLPSVANLNSSRLHSILVSDAYQKRLAQMLRHECPGCGCGCLENLKVCLAL